MNTFTIAEEFTPIFNVGLWFLADTACMAEDLSFKDLFEHLSRYMKDPEQRWKHVMRVKRGLRDPNDVGGYGNDQCYFEGENNDALLFLLSESVCKLDVRRMWRKMNITNDTFFLEDCIRAERDLKPMASCLLK